MKIRICLTVIAMCAAALVGSPAPGAATCPDQPFDAPTGAAAVRAAGEALPELASEAAMTQSELRETLLEDPTLHLDPCNGLFYIDPPIPEASGAAFPEHLTPGTNVFALHSKPTSARTIYLDFDGYTVSATSVWTNATRGSYTVGPFDTDGNAAFSQSELDTIASVWLRVAEDYAPFDVDVTTELTSQARITRSNAADNEYGTRVVITTGDNPIYPACNCGGVAARSAFARSDNHADYQPAWVFTGGSGALAKNVAEVASHETGHTLSLQHDGTSTEVYYSPRGLWAPIMGASYYSPVTQWSEGEYPDANNTEDDLVAISTHGAPALPADGNDTRGTATALSGSGSGMIASRSDVDWYTFTAQNLTTITVTTQPAGPDLDASLSLYNASGTQLGSTVDPLTQYTSSDQVTGLDATIARNLSAGTYYVKVDGVGSGSPLSGGYSDYGSLGRYDIVMVTNQSMVSLPAAALPTGTVNVAYRGTITANNGMPPYRFGITGGALPAGLGMSGLGAITGTPRTPGTFPFTVTVTDAGDFTSSQTFSLVVKPQLLITRAALPQGRVGSPYSARFAATGGSEPYAFQLYAGAVPDGLTLAPNGTISGTPTRAGNVTIGVSVTDANTVMDAALFGLTIRSAPTPTATPAATPAPSTPSISIGTTRLPKARVGKKYSAALRSSSPGVWRITGGHLPKGLRLKADHIVGRPKKAGTARFTVRVSAADGASASVRLRIVVKRGR